MTSEIRTNSITSRAGLSTVTMTDSGPMFSGITTFVDNSGFTFGVGGGTSIFTPATNVLTFGTNNTEKIRIDASGHMHGVGVITATHFYGDGSNLTGITGTTINNNGSNRIITGSSTANTLEGEATFTYDGTSVAKIDTSQTYATFRLDGNAGGAIEFYENGTRRFEIYGIDAEVALYDRDKGAYHTRFKSGGNVEISDGKLLIGTSTKGYGDLDDLTIATSGNTGITIRSGTSSLGVIGFADGTSGNAQYRGVIQYSHSSDFMQFNTADAERLRIDNAGRVMINQTTNIAGTAKLEVMGTGDNSYPMYSYAIGVCDTQAYNVSNGTGMGIGFSYKHNSSGNTALGCGIRGFKENTTDGNYAGAMAFYTRANGAGAGERGRFSSAGTFGVGTVNPDSNYKIDCNGRLRIGDGNAGHRIQFSRSGLGDELVLGVDGYGSSTNNEAVIQSSINTGRPLVLRTSNGDRLRIAANGRVGVWETEAKINAFAEALQVRGLYGNQYALAAKINQSSGSIMRFSTVNPTNGNDDVCGSITGNGTSCSFNTSSDYRLKENDVKITDGITRIKQLRPIRFNWKTDSSSTQDGFFAHEVSPVVPESVTGEKDAEINEIGEGYQKIDHSKLVPLLTAALQEAITKIEKLEQDNIALRARVTNLEGN